MKPAKAPKDKYIVEFVNGSKLELDSAQAVNEFVRKDKRAYQIRHRNQIVLRKLFKG